MKNVVFEQFDCLDAFMRGIERPLNNVWRGHDESSQEKDSRGGWYGTSSFEEAVDLIRNGWTEKADEIRKEFASFERAQQRDVTYEKSRPATAVIGFTPHVPNAIMGLPNSMIYTERTPMKAKVVRLIYNPCMNAGTDADDIMNAGLTALKIAWSMERKGYRVRLDVTPKFSSAAREDTCCLVCVKEWRQPIDIKKIAFPMAHPSMFRRMGFRWLETTPGLTDRDYLGGYGRSMESEERDKEVLKGCGVLGDNDYYLNVGIAQKNKFDLQKVAKAIGIKVL